MVEAIFKGKIYLRSSWTNSSYVGFILIMALFTSMKDIWCDRLVTSPTVGQNGRKGITAWKAGQVMDANKADSVIICGSAIRSYFLRIQWRNFAICSDTTKRRVPTDLDTLVTPFCDDSRGHCSGPFLRDFSEKETSENITFENAWQSSHGKFKQNLFIKISTELKFSGFLVDKRAPCGITPRINLIFFKFN